MRIDISNYPSYEEIMESLGIRPRIAEAVSKRLASDCEADYRAASEIWRKRHATQDQD